MSADFTARFWDIHQNLRILFFISVNFNPCRNMLTKGGDHVFGEEMWWKMFQLKYFDDKNITWLIVNLNFFFRFLSLNIVFIFPWTK
jgi:hypothetical protein